MKQERSAGVIAYYEHSKHNSRRLYLMLRYPSGYWDFPKGRLEANESNREAALRELKEETGLVVDLESSFEYTVAYDFRDRDGVPVHKKVTFFVGKAISDNVVLSAEHEESAWLSLGDALKVLTYHNARQALQLADQFLDVRLQHMAESDNSHNSSDNGDNHNDSCHC
jgi:bis(5'-nucleosidyl)-tetraphosphatase